MPPNANEAAASSISPSPRHEKPPMPPAPRFTSTTPEKPTAQPAARRAVIRSPAHRKCARSTPINAALESMIAPFVPVVCAMPA